MQYGYLNMILPFMTVIATPLICSMADRQQSHRSCFTISLILTTMSLVSYALLPLLLDTPASKSPQDKQLHIVPWIYFCLTSLVCDLAMGINTCLSYSFAVLQAEEQGTSFGRVIVWGTFGWASSALVLSLINQWTALPSLLPGLLFGVVLLTIDVIIVSFWPKSSNFKLDIIPMEAAQTVTGSSSSTHHDPSDYLPLNESARINMGQEFDWEEGKVLRKTISPVDISFANSVKDETKALKEPCKFDQSQNLNQTQHLTLTADSFDKGAKIRRASSYSTSFRIQMKLLLLIMRRRKALVRYFVLFILSGFFMSMQWNYFFLYLEEIYYNKFALISALSMVGQSLLGELPFFILSRKVIDCLGRSHTLSVSVISIGIRFLIYAYLLPNYTMYCIVLADCLQGPNYGLFYVVMTEVGLEFSYCDDETIEQLASGGDLDRLDQRQVDSVRLSLRSTVQSVAFACYEGIGVGIGSLVGGWLVAEYGFRTLWQSMAIGSIVLGIINIFFELVFPEFEPEAEKSARFEFVEAYRRGTLKKFTSPTPLAAVTASPLVKIRLPDGSLNRRLNDAIEGKSNSIAVAAPEAIQRPVLRKSAGKLVAPPAGAVDR